MTHHSLGRRILRACYRACGLCYCGRDVRLGQTLCPGCYARAGLSRAAMRKRRPDYWRRYYVERVKGRAA